MYDAEAESESMGVAMTFTESSGEKVKSSKRRRVSAAMWSAME